MREKINNVQHCECERRVKPLFARQIAYRMLLEHEQGAHFDQTIKNALHFWGSKKQSFLRTFQKFVDNHKRDDPSELVI